MDDDTYVNIPGLLKLLQQYNHSDDWYLGKPSLNHPLEVRDVDSPGVCTCSLTFKHNITQVFKGLVML